MIGKHFPIFFPGVVVVLMLLLSPEAKQLLPFFITLMLLLSPEAKQLLPFFITHVI
jgi:hypothetical protein